jgi:hypothetical protein
MRSSLPTAAVATGYQGFVLPSKFRVLDSLRVSFRSLAWIILWMLQGRLTFVIGAVQFDYPLNDLPLVPFEDGRNNRRSGQHGRVWYSQEEPDCQPCEGNSLPLLLFHLVLLRFEFASVGRTFIVWTQCATCFVLVLLRSLKGCDFGLHSDSLWVLCASVPLCTWKILFKAIRKFLDTCILDSKALFQIFQACMHVLYSSGGF